MERDTEGLKRWLRGLLDVPFRGTVVDAGCGQGDDLLAIAREHPETHVIGIDRSDWRGSDAKECSPPNARFLLADLARPFPIQSESVDALYSVNVLECLPDQSTFLKECARVLRPNGQIVLAHFDWDTQTFDGPDRDLVRQIVQSFSDWKQAWMEAIDPWTGRRLRRLFVQSGEFVGDIRAYTLISTSFDPGSYGRRQADSFEAMVRRGIIASEQYEAFMRFQREAAAEDGFMFSVTMFAFVGRKQDKRLT